MYIGSLNEVMCLDESKYLRKAGHIARSANIGNIIGQSAATGYELYKTVKNPFRSLDPNEVNEARRNISLGGKIGTALGAGKGLYGAIKAGNKDKDIWNKKDNTATKFKKGAKFIGRNTINMAGDYIGGAIGGGVGTGIGMIGGAPGMIGGAVGGSYLGSKYGGKAGEYISNKLFGKEK